MLPLNELKESLSQLAVERVKESNLKHVFLATRGDDFVTIGRGSDGKAVTYRRMPDVDSLNRLLIRRENDYRTTIAFPDFRSGNRLPPPDPPHPYYSTQFLHVAFPEDVRRTFTTTFLTNATDEAYRLYSRALRRVGQMEYRELFALAGARDDYVLGVTLLGRRPTGVEFGMLRTMRDALLPLVDTPIVAGVMLKWHVMDYQKRIKPHTREAALARARAQTPASLTRAARAVLDPDGLLAPAQWRWFTQLHPRYLAKLGPDTGRPFVLRVKMYANVFHDVRAYSQHVHEFLPAISYAGGITPLMQIGLEAVKKYVESPKADARLPWHTPAGQGRVLMGLAQNEGHIVIDGDLRRASLQRLYDMVDTMGLNEPPESLAYGRCAFEFPTGQESVKVGSLTFVPLVTHVDVYREGVEMRHCIFTGWIRYMKEGTYRAYGVWRGDDHIATLLVHKRHGGKTWEVEQYGPKFSQGGYGPRPPEVHTFEKIMNGGQHG